MSKPRRNRVSRLRRDESVAKKVMIYGGAAVCLGSAAFVAAPILAAAAGAVGVLGAAGTGTAITTLSGAALTSASLAAVGGGTVIGGTLVLTGIGASTGAAFTAILRSMEEGKLEEAEKKIIALKRKNAAEMRQAYSLNKRNMSPEMRKLWRKHLA